VSPVLVHRIVWTEASDAIVEGSLDSGDWLRAGATVVAALVAAIVLGRIVRSVLTRWVGKDFASLFVSRLVAYLTFVIGFIYALTGLSVRLGPLLGALGLGGLVLALALQKPVENFFDGVILQTRRPFLVGDSVLLGEHLGVVTDIDSRTTVLRSLDGPTIRIPNASVTNGEIINLTQDPVRRSRLDVGVAYSTDLDVATAALGIAVSRVQRILHEPPPLVMLSEFGESSIVFTIYYWHGSDIPSELATRHDLILAVHQNLMADGITIAFPQMVVWSGIDSDAAVYEQFSGPIRTELPGVGNRPESRARRRSGAPWRRGRQRPDDSL
jgi:small-conductance mechanosensitive channel